MLVCSLCGHELVGSSSRRAVQTLFGPHGSPVDFSFDVFICASIKVTLKMFWDKWIHSSPLLHVQHISTVILMTCQLMNCGSQQQYIRPNWMDSPWSVELFTSLESKQNISHHTWVTGTTTNLWRTSELVSRLALQIQSTGHSFDTLQLRLQQSQTRKRHREFSK